MSSVASDGARTRATLVGLGAVALWSSLAALTVLAGAVPPFQLTSMAFAVGTVVGLAYAWFSGQSLGALRYVPLGAWVLGLYGLLGYHVCYFAAMQRAPVLEASLINYLWPLLIVVFAALLPAALRDRPLTGQHVIGALAGFAGCALVLVQGHSATATSSGWTGHLLAAAAALIWSSYSVASRLFRDVPSTAVIGFCAGTAVGAGAIHCFTETWVWPVSLAQWLAIAAMGLGPLGLAFYLWDEGMKHGDILRIGVASYAAPLLSTLFVTALGLGSLTPAIGVAAVLITAGAVIAGREQTPAS